MLYSMFTRSATHFALTVALTFSAIPALAGEYRITFFAQNGVPPEKIEIDNGAEFSASFELTETQSAVIDLADFNDVIDTFFVTAVYGDNRTQSFELRLLRPSEGSARQEKSIFLSEPGRFLGQNYVKAVGQSRSLLRRDRRKAFVPFFQCRESFFKASDVGDKQTAIQALDCWVQSNHRMVFADPSSTRRLLAPDPDASQAFADLMDNISRGDEGWRSGLDASRLRERDLKRLATQVLEIELSDWLYYKPIRSYVRNAADDESCAQLKKYRKARQELSPKEIELLSGARFGIEFDDDRAANVMVSLSTTCEPATSL